MARSFALDARRSLQKILKAFKKYDRSGDGKISTDELQPMMTELFGWDGESEARRQKVRHLSALHHPEMHAVARCASVPHPSWPLHAEGLGHAQVH